jgi:hypothetical protein
MKKILCLAVVIGLSLTSCKGVQTATSDYAAYYENPSGVAEWELGNGKILFYNGGYYYPVAYSAKSTRANLKINGKSVPTTEYGEFFLLNLPYGEYEFEVELYDVFIFKKSYKIKVDEDTKLFRIQPIGFGKKVVKTTSLPTSFRSYSFPSRAKFSK